MGNEAQAAVGYRVQIRATVGTPSSGGDIANVNTAVLPNGALCFVLSNRGLYEFDRFSSAAASGFEIVVPTAGGGRWLLRGAGASSVIQAALYSTQALNNAFVVDGNWQPSTGANFFAPNIGSYWTLTAAGGILTYSGPRSPVRLQLMASIGVDGGTPPYTVYAGISVKAPAAPNPNLNGALAGTNGGIRGVNIYTPSADGLIVNVSSQRVLGEIFPGDVIQPRFGSTAVGEVAGTIYSLQLVVEPV